MSKNKCAVSAHLNRANNQYWQGFNVFMMSGFRAISAQFLEYFYSKKMNLNYSMPTLTGGIAEVHRVALGKLWTA